MHTHHIIKSFLSDQNLILLRDLVGKAHMHVCYTFLKTNKGTVGLKPNLNILYYMWFVIVLFLFVECF